MQINNIPIARTNNAKLLGITVQNDLKHYQTITNIIKKLQQVIHKFRYANKLLSTHDMKEQYYSLAYPHLIGAISLWGTEKPNSTRLQPLIRTQKKIIRLVAKRPPRTHTRPLMIDLNILGITDIYILRVCAEMHEHIYQRAPKNRPEHNHNYISTAQVHEYPTRHSKQQNYYISNRRENPQCAMQHYTRKYTAIWNQLPLEIRQTQTLTTFKRLVTEHLLEIQKEAEKQSVSNKVADPV